MQKFNISVSLSQENVKAPLAQSAPADKVPKIVLSKIYSPNDMDSIKTIEFIVKKTSRIITNYINKKFSLL